MKLIKAKDQATDDILGVVPDTFSPEQERELVERISAYYGFKCAVFSESMEVLS